MRKIMLILTIFLIISGCNVDTFKENEVERKSETDKRQDKKETTPSGKRNPIGIGNLISYRPKVGTTITYTNNGEVIYKHVIVAENQDYIQLTVYLSGAPTTQIYRWTDSELTLVFEESSPGNPNENKLEDFLQNKEERFISFSEIAEWAIVEASKTVKVPYGVFKEVFVLQKVTDEVEGADTIYKRYFAPSIGMIKETYNVTGEKGYNDGAELDQLK